MRISCDHCGAVFDSSEHTVCPECGASYGDSPDVKNVEYYEQKKRDYDLEQEQQRLEAQRQRNMLYREQVEEQKRKNEQAFKARKFANGMNRGCTGVLIAAGIIFLIIVIFAVKIGIEEVMEERKNTVVTTEETTTEIPLVKAEGRFGEDIDTGRYTFKIDKIELTDYYPWSGAANHSCILIHMLLTNKTDSDIDADLDEHVVADGIAQRSFFLPEGYRDFASTLPKGLTAEGWAKFEIPDDAEEMEFLFGDYVVCRFTWDDVQTENQ